MAHKKLRAWLVGAAAAALPLAGVTVLTGAPPASADAVIGSVTNLGAHDVDVNGTPTAVSFWAATFGPRYLYMTSLTPQGTARFLTAVDAASGNYVQDWQLPLDESPNDSLVADGDTVWVSTTFPSFDTRVFKVGQADPIADFPDAGSVAVVGGRAYVFGGDANVPAVTVLDDDPSNSGYLTPVATPTPPSSLDSPTSSVTSGGDDLFVDDGASIEVVDADPASPTYLTITGTAPAPSDNYWIATDAGGDRLLSWGFPNAISVYDVVDGRPVPDGEFGEVPSTCSGVAASLSPDGRRAYVTTCDVPDEVRVYDMTAPSHPQMAAIESFAGAGTMALAVSPDGTKLTTGGDYPKIAALTGYASTPVITAPKLPLPGDDLTVALGDWSTTPTWQWLRNGTPIPGTTNASTYSVTKADLGAKLTVHALVDGLGDRSSAPITVANGPRITATMTGQRRTGWYVGQARVTFICTPGTGRIIHCPSASVRPAGTNQRVAGTAVDQYGLTATVVRSGIDVCDRCVAGAGYAGGRWVVHRAQHYTVAIVGGPRPLSAGLARPGSTTAFHRVTTRRGVPVGGRTVWFARVAAPAGRGLWTLSYRQGRSTTRVPLIVR